MEKALSYVTSLILSLLFFFWKSLIASIKHRQHFMPPFETRDDIYRILLVVFIGVLGAIVATYFNRTGGALVCGYVSGAFVLCVYCTRASQTKIFKAQLRAHRDISRRRKFAET